MIARGILYFGKPCALACDGRCDKAWGINNRPRVVFDPNDEDDFAYLADDEVGEAPVNPGTYEGGYGKPQILEERLNTWCARECERSTVVSADKIVTTADLPDFSGRVYNIPSRHGWFK